MQILVLETGLFPDAQTLIEGVRQLELQHVVERIDVSRSVVEEEEWDRVLRAILASDLVLTT